MKQLIITIVATLLLAAAGAALAQDYSGEPGRKGSRNQRGMQPMPMTEQVMRAIRHLDLNEEQKAGIKAVMQGLKEEIHPIMREMRAGQEQMKELVKAEGYDEKAVALVAEREGELAAQRIMLTSEALSNILAQLTEEQRAQLDTMAAERKGRHGGKNKPGSQGS